MKPIKVVIIDDEPAAAEVIDTLLKEFTTDISVAGIAKNGLEAVQMLTMHKPDLVFLDVDMPVMNGFQVLEKLPGMHFEVIFTTGSSEYALKALKLKAVDYLLKPIDPADFIVAIERARNLLEQKQEQTTRIIPHAINTRIQLPSQSGIIFLDEHDIMHITGMGSYCQVHTGKGEKITVSKNIGQIEQKLSASHFFRCHNSHIINLVHVSKFLNKDGYAVEMTNGIVIEVSRRSKENLLTALAQHSK